MHVIKDTIPFVIAKSILKEYWSEFKEIMKINNFIHAPIWPLWFLNKYLFFIYPLFVTQKEAFSHETLEFTFKSCVFISCFCVSGFTNCTFEVRKVLNNPLLKSAKQLEHLYWFHCFRQSFQEWTNWTPLRTAGSFRTSTANTLWL